MNPRLTCGRMVPVMILAVLSLATPPQAFCAEKIVTLDYRIFPGLAEMDGNWAALTVAHDGKVYAGLACHGCDGHLVMYDPATDRVNDLGNLTRLAGEASLRIGPQSKIHAKFGEGVVLGLEPGGIIRVFFQESGEQKRLLLEYAPLRRV